MKVPRLRIKIGTITKLQRCLNTIEMLHKFTQPVGETKN